MAVFEKIDSPQETLKIEQSEKKVEQKKQSKTNFQIENNSKKNKHSKTPEPKKKAKTFKNIAKNQQIKSNKKNIDLKKANNLESENKNVKLENKENKIVVISGKKYSYVKKITGDVTAYTADGKKLTSTGKIPKCGMAAVDPKKIPYGSKVIAVFRNGKTIECVANDTGGALKNGKCALDIYLNSKKECLNFGRSFAEIYVLEK
ncbi:MAG: 3D domain-containing protein [Oscillospiraceae bacterium]|jgi:3D (Asp-Asp-Asp) domain-containing protein|nr:3D domain-containing protein [Oscillospiraceae bacterium]